VTYDLASNETIVFFWTQTVPSRCAQCSLPGNQTALAEVGALIFAYGNYKQSPSPCASALSAYLSVSENMNMTDVNATVSLIPMILTETDDGVQSVVHAWLHPFTDLSGPLSRSHYCLFDDLIDDFFHSECERWRGSLFWLSTLRRY
jgi:hypothetical protein